MTLLMTQSIGRANDRPNQICTHSHKKNEIDRESKENYLFVCSGMSCPLRLKRSRSKRQHMEGALSKT